MVLFRILLAPLLIAAVSLGQSCQKEKNKDDPAAATPTEPGFSLSLARDKWVDSEYCGKTRPTLPANPKAPARFEKSFLNEKLSTTGLNGWMHGAVHSYRQYLFTYRKELPNGETSFFEAEQFSLVPVGPEVAAAFATLNRHDKVRLYGEVFENGSSLTHIKVTKIEVVKPYDKATENSYSFDFSKLKGQKTFEVFGQVHATAFDEKLGYAVIVEYGEVLLPIAVSPAFNKVAAELYKGDIVNVSVQVVEHPNGPPHFMTNPESSTGIEVVDPMLHCHGQERVVEGYLVKFEKSPTIDRDVYAVRVVDKNGIARNFTFFPNKSDEDPEFFEIFMAVSAKAKSAWDSEASEPKVVRNYRSKDLIWVKAKGIMNVVSTEQANAQVYLNSADDVTFETRTAQ